jgi:outer membrane lipoprotein-sorting protein
MKHRSICIAFLAGLAVLVSLGAASQPLTTAEDVLDRMRANAQAIEDLAADLTVQTFADGEVQLTQTIRLSLLQPDRMRQEYLSPDYLAGNLTLVIGDEMWIFIAAADTWYEKDLSELSTAEQPWLVFRQFLRAVVDEFDDYAFVLLSTDNDVYQLEGEAINDDAVYGRIELWVNAATFVPDRRIVYDIDGNLLVDLRILEVEHVEDVAYFARALETYDENGILKSRVQYDTLTVNAGIDPDLFEGPNGASADD